MGILEKISEIEKEIARTQKNKATEYHLGLLKAKLAKYRGFDVMKSGDARVALIGFPSVGKVSDGQCGPRGGKQEVIFQTGDHPGSPRCLSA
uniref:Developmentally regulated GTP binding protein 2 n=1 Tax=Pan paniscus TaxID=9597 RepID=A0A2R8ZUT6_PANPA